MKKYLYSVSIPGRMWANVAFYADTPAKNYRIYYCGSDTGARFEYLGNAARALLQLVNDQNKNGVTGHIFEYVTRDEIPRRGSNA